jgi:cytochrome c biogenesis protein CcmG/thiol:disulfide interchange protein DsbE
MTKPRLLVSIQTAAAVTLIALCFIVADALQEKVVGVGDRAPSFTIVADNGRQVSTKDFGGKVLVLNFWATWCPPCIEELPSLEAMAKELAPKGVVVLGVSVDRNAAAYERFRKQARITFLTARDEEARISSSYGTFKYPETYVIDSQGRVRQKHIGPRNWLDPEIVRSIEALL